jgi:methionine synthase I (cobalamin-dependent)/5,10-methylenetetrahydrofolate reductase
MNLHEYLKTHTIITDGAFGTYYAEKYGTNELPELANTEHPERVLEIHLEYLAAGASYIRTNTYATNSRMLSENENEIMENLDAAVKAARDAVSLSKRSDPIFIAGDIGPIPGMAGMEKIGNEQEYIRLADRLLKLGVDAVHFETFADCEEIAPAIKYIREQSENVFISVCFSVNQYGYSTAGLSAKRLVADISKLPVDAVGLNCGVGAGHMEQLIGNLSLPSDKYFAALANAGYPDFTRNRMHFGNAPIYFAGKMREIAHLGVSMVGGCCGTKPDTIRAVADAMADELLHEPADMAGQPKKFNSDVTDGTAKNKRAGFLYDENGNVKDKKFIAVELAPPFDANDEKLLESAHALVGAGVDVLTFPDSPSGRTRVDSILMAEKVSKETGMCVMPHLCCRDKNAIAMRSQLLGAHINGINNFLVVTGDPVPAVARQTVKAVFNFNSIGLMNIIHDMNTEQFADSPVVFGGAINQNRRNLNVEIDRIRKKMEMGADFFFTQPVFTEKGVNLLRQIKEETGARILCGVMPFVSRRNAVFMKNEMTGIEVDEQIIARYPENATKEEGEAVGIEIAREVMAQTADFVDGYYFSFPFNRVYLLEKILQL